jgi:hypothetical protein
MIPHPKNIDLEMHIRTEPGHANLEAGFPAGLLAVVPDDLQRRHRQGGDAAPMIVNNIIAFGGSVEASCAVAVAKGLASVTVPVAKLRGKELP